MEALESRQSIGLPSISNLDKVKREEMDFQRKHPAPPAPAPLTPLHPLSHHSHQSSPANAVPGPLGGLLSPPESRRTSGEDDAQRAPARQSLPSIQEALGAPEPHHAFSAPAPAPAPPPAPTSAPQSYFPPSTTSPPDQRTRAFSDVHGSQGPSNPFAQARSPFMGTSTSTAPPPPPPPAPIDSLPRPSFAEHRPSFSESRASFSTPQQNSKLPTLHPLRTNPSPPPGPGRPNYPYSSYPPQPSATHEPAAPHSAGSMNPNYGYQQYPPNYHPLSAPTPGAPNSSFPPSAATYSPHPRNYSAQQWDNRTDEKKLGRSTLAPYGESVKRHLESFDLEASLNEMAEGAGRITDFSKIYRQRAHENQRIGMTPQSMPRLEEVDEMMKHNERITVSLQRMREVVFNHQASMVEPPQDPRFSRMNGFEHDAQSNYGDDAKGAGGFAGPDPKKRRGPTQRAAPPGRCHSCNRAETPEWRRGPDGARTLCNACGLHYAKLTRKMGGKQALTSSNLRPKSLDQGSPTG